MDLQPTASGSDLLKQITVLDAIYWMNNAWAEVETSTIVKCFAKSGFVLSSFIDANSESDDEDDLPLAAVSKSDENIPLAALKLTKEIFGVEFSELVDIDKDLHTCDTQERDWESPAQQILNELNDSAHVPDDDSSDDDEPDDYTQVCSVSEASMMIAKLKKFGLHHGCSEMLECVSKLDEQVALLSVTQCKQQKISNYFMAEKRS